MDPSEHSYTVRDFLYVMFKHKGKILTIFLATVLTVTIASFVMTPTYRATSKILVKFGRENLYTPAILPSGSPLPTIDVSREEHVNSEIEMLRGRNVIEKVVGAIGAKNLYPGIDRQWLPSLSSVEPSTFEKAVLQFQKKLSVEGIKKSNVIEVAFEHSDPVVAARAVNKLIDSFVEFHLSAYNQPKAYDFFGDQVKLLYKKVEDSQKALDSFRTRYSISSLPEQKTFLLKQISEIEIEQAKTAAEISENMGRRNSLVGSPSSSADRTRYGNETDTNVHAISDIKGKIALLRLKEEELVAKYNEDNYLVTAIRKEIERAEQLLAAEEKTYHDKEIRTIDHTLKAFTDKQQSQKSHLSRYQADLRSITSLEMQLKDMERQLRIDEENYQQYVRKREEGRMFNAMDTEKMVNISVVEPALKPIKPVKPRKMLNVMLAVFLGGFAGLGMAFSSEALNRTLDKRDDVERYLGFPVLGSIPHLPATKLGSFPRLPPHRDDR